jgi:NCAIR mutase (PurE)-related protein
MGEKKKGIVAVVSAGTTDEPIAMEALETLAWMGVPTRLMQDIGVAGPYRLMSQVPVLQTMDAIVCIAGMEGALPSVLAGHVRCPVIAVPTSIGYGANFAGLSALLSMLNSCAANIAVVNIDAGFKGGYLAGLIANR